MNHDIDYTRRLGTFHNGLVYYRMYLRIPSDLGSTFAAWKVRARTWLAEKKEEEYLGFLEGISQD